MNKRKRVAWEKHRIKRKKLDAKRREAKAGPVAGARAAAAAAPSA